MSKIKWLLIASALVVSVSGCFIDLDDDDDIFGCIRGRGPVISVVLDLAPFDGIDVKMPAVVYVKQGPVQQVVVEGEENIIEEIERDIRNGIWEIEPDRCIRDMEELRIYVTLPDVSRLRISSSGNIVSENILVVNDIELTISGSGDIDVGLDADDVDANIFGSGRIYLEGIANDLNVRITGSGDLRGFDLEALEADVEITGSGNAEVRVVNRLDVRISGSGNVYYKGFPPALNVSITGSGRVVNRN